MSETGHERSNTIVIEEERDGILARGAQIISSGADIAQIVDAAKSSPDSAEGQKTIRYCLLTKIFLSAISSVTLIMFVRTLAVFIT